MTKDSDQTSSQADFLANLSQSQEKENQKKMTEISGKKLLELSKSADPLGLLERTLMGLLNSISTPYSRIWKAKVTPKRGALIFQLRASVQNTKEKESGLWATPNTMDHLPPRSKEGTIKLMTGHRKGRTRPSNLREQVDAATVQMYPTPTQDSASERTKKYKQGGTPLPMAVKMLPTPTVGCEEGGEQSQRVELTKRGSFLLRKKNPNAKHKTFGAKLSDAMLYLEKPKTGGRLSANFTEYLMGFPMDWTKIDQTESKDSETQSAHQSYFTSDVRCMKLKGKWMPGAKKEEARNEDKSELLRVLSLLSKEPVKCSKKDCDKIADEIIDRFPFCKEHAAEYQKVKNK